MVERLLSQRVLCDWDRQTVDSGTRADPQKPVVVSRISDSSKSYSSASHRGSGRAACWLSLLLTAREAWLLPRASFTADTMLGIRASLVTNFLSLSSQPGVRYACCLTSSATLSGCNLPGTNPSRLYRCVTQTTRTTKTTL